MIKEIWRTINIFDGRFEVSNLGNVRDKITGNLLSGDINNFGYYRVCLWYNSKHKKFFRHRLVAEYFIPNSDENKRFVNHIDGNKSNNSIYNLEWVTQSENEKHAFQTGLKSKTNKPFKIIFEDDIEKLYDNQYICADDIGVSRTSIKNWLNGLNKGYRKHGIKQIYFIKV